MFCEKCGSQIPDGSSFCENCGAPVSSSAAPAPEAPQAPKAPPKRPSRKKPDRDPQWTQPEPRKHRGGLLIGILIPVLITAGVFAMKLLNAPDDIGPGPAAPPAAGQPAPQQHQQQPQQQQPQQPAGPDMPAPPADPAPQTAPDAPGAPLQAAGVPTLEDFDWYASVKAEGWLLEGEPIEDFAECTGTWKCMTAYMHGDDLEDVYARELSTAHISGTRDSAELVMEMHTMYWNNAAPEDETGLSLEFSGGWDPDFQAMCMSGPAELILDNFVRLDGREYAWCVLLTPEGDIADVMLTRP